MPVLSNYIIPKLLDKVYRNTDFTSPTSVYVALFVTDPTPAASGTEVSTSGTSYARQAVTFGAVASNQSKNTGTINWTTATGNWGAVGWLALFDASTGGNMLSYVALSATITVNTGQQFPQIPIDALIATFT